MTEGLALASGLADWRQVGFGWATTPSVVHSSSALPPSAPSMWPHPETNRPQVAWVALYSLGYPPLPEGGLNLLEVEDIQALEWQLKG